MPPTIIHSLSNYRLENNAAGLAIRLNRSISDRATQVLLVFAIAIASTLLPDGGSQNDSQTFRLVVSGLAGFLAAIALVGWVGYTFEAEFDIANQELRIVRGIVRPRRTRTYTIPFADLWYVTVMYSRRSGSGDPDYFKCSLGLRQRSGSTCEILALRFDAPDGETFLQSNGGKELHQLVDEICTILGHDRTKVSWRDSSRWWHQ